MSCGQSGPIYAEEPLVIKKDQQCFSCFSSTINSRSDDQIPKPEDSLNMKEGLGFRAQSRFHPFPSFFSLKTHMSKVDVAQLEQQYGANANFSQSLGGTIYSTTPGGTVYVYDPAELLKLSASPLSVPPADLPVIPGVTNNFHPEDVTEVSEDLKNEDAHDHNSEDDIFEME
ncbi:hypothetical protein PCE1_000224 [Barthelona sp. PCE]